MSDDSDVTCPNCGSDAVETLHSGEYHCLECDLVFTEGGTGTTVHGPKYPPDEDEEGDGDE